ncbi:4775_t:CDS:2 [Funneliformis geosporum]|uniref:4775_t:CDS:1 n=1 Tax=Funneliformis geosporum TaxID=1117311 RepID=A0A9W4WYQ0_9GLOM|nr:4775_t:CDS:2 [Funneliformis geosporum]
MSSKISKTLVKSKKSKSKRSSRSKNAAKTKVVVRRLPPLILEQSFFASVEQWVNKETCNWSRFHQGRISKSKNKESIFSRAYLHFKTVEQVLEFHRGYDNHLFIDGQGNENRAVVEFAIYQKLPKEHKKPDPRQGTIETDPDYIAFLESLKVEETQHATMKEPGILLESGATQLERLEARLANAAAIIAANAVEKPKTTPLLEHLRALKSAAKSKSQPSKQVQIAILSPPGSPAKGISSKAAKQSQHSRAVHANEANQSFQNTASESSMSEPPIITIVPRPQIEEKEKETRRAPVKITIQQRQKEQIRQFIQPSLTKKELDTIEINSKETIDKEIEINESRVTDQKDIQKEISKRDDKDAVSKTFSSTFNTAVTSTSIMNNPSSSYRRRNKKHSTDVKQPIQIQILTKPQNQSAESNITPNNNNNTINNATTTTASSASSSSAAASNAPPPIRRRGYFGKRGGGRW